MFQFLRREDIERKLRLTKSESYRAFPPSALRGRVRSDKVLEFLSKRACAGASVGSFVPDCIDVAEVCAIAKCSRRSLFGRLAKRIPHFRITSRRLLFNKEDVVRWADQSGWLRIAALFSACVLSVAVAIGSHTIAQAGEVDVMTFKREGSVVRAVHDGVVVGEWSLRNMSNPHGSLYSFNTRSGFTRSELETMFHRYLALVGSTYPKSNQRAEVK